MILKTDFFITDCVLDRERGPARLRKSFQQILERERKRSETSGRREHEDGGGDRLEQEGQIDFQEENILLDERSRLVCCD